MKPLVANMSVSSLEAHLQQPSGAGTKARYRGVTGPTNSPPNGVSPPTSLLWSTQEIGTDHWPMSTSRPCKVLQAQPQPAVNLSQQCYTGTLGGVANVHRFGLVHQLLGLLPCELGASKMSI